MSSALSHLRIVLSHCVNFGIIPTSILLLVYCISLMDAIMRTSNVIVGSQENEENPPCQNEYKKDTG